MLFVSQGSDLSPSNAALITAVDLVLCADFHPFFSLSAPRISAPNQQPVSKLYSWFLPSIQIARYIYNFFLEEHKPIRGTPSIGPKQVVGSPSSLARIEAKISDLQTTLISP